MIQIREYTEKDKNQLVSLMEEFSQHVTVTDPTGRTLHKASSGKYFTNKLLEDVSKKGGRVFVAWEDDKMVGLIGGYVIEQDEEEQMESIPLKPAYISEFFVTDIHRGKSIGKKLIDVLEEYFKSIGRNEIRLEAMAFNARGLNFYHRNGYTTNVVTLIKSL